MAWDAIAGQVLGNAAPGPALAQARPGPAPTSRVEYEIQQGRCSNWGSSRSRILPNPGFAEIRTLAQAGFEQASC
jgi:hypothetical protein